MPRWALVALLVLGVACAAAGTALTLRTTPLGAAGFGWTAWSPLSGSAYSPGDPTRAFWGPKVDVALIAFGAGVTGVTSVALLLTRRPKDRTAGPAGEGA